MIGVPAGNVLARRGQRQLGIGEAFHVVVGRPRRGESRDQRHVARSKIVEQAEEAPIAHEGRFLAQGHLMEQHARRAGAVADLVQDRLLGAA